MRESDPHLVATVKLTTGECAYLVDLLQIMEEWLYAKDNDFDDFIVIMNFAKTLNLADTRKRLLDGLQRAEAIEAALQSGASKVHQ